MLPEQVSSLEPSGSACGEPECTFCQALERELNEEKKIITTTFECIKVQLISYKRYLECTNVQWRLSIYPKCTQVAESTFLMKSPVVTRRLLGKCSETFHRSAGSARSSDNSCFGTLSIQASYIKIKSTFSAVLFGDIVAALLGLLHRHSLTVLLGHLRFNILDTDVLEFLCTYVYTGIGEEL